MKKFGRIAWLGQLTLGVLVLGACDSDEAGQMNGEDAAQTQSDEIITQTDSAGPRRYQAKEGMIVYAVSGVQSGAETLYWRDWGREEAKYTDTSMSMMGITQVTKTWSIITPETIITINQVNNTATSITNPAETMFEGMTQEQLENMGEQMMVQMGATQDGTDTVAGQECDVWKIPMGNATTCLWQGLALSNKAGMAGMNMSTVATTIDTSTSPGDEHFTVPDGVTITDIGSIPGLDGFAGFPGMPGSDN